MGNYNDHLMQTLAQNGNGVAAYIDTLSEARKVLADEAGGALIPIAKDVKIQVEFNPAQISEYRLIGYETRALDREDFNNDKVDAGEIGAGHTVTALYEVTPTGSPAETIDELRYAEAEITPTTASETGDELAFVKIRYKRPNDDTSTLITRPIGPNDEAQSLDTASAETQFAAAVSAFGQILRGSSRIGAYTYDDVIDLAVASKGNDEFGYRAEFINLVRLAKSLDTRR
jgi:Ca-activated chloride channel family protein